MDLLICHNAKRNWLFGKHYAYGVARAVHETEKALGLILEVLLVPLNPDF